MRRRTNSATVKSKQPDPVNSGAPFEPDLASFRQIKRLAPFRIIYQIIQLSRAFYRWIRGASGYAQATTRIKRIYSYDLNWCRRAAATRKPPWPCNRESSVQSAAQDHHGQTPQADASGQSWSQRVQSDLVRRAPFKVQTLSKWLGPPAHTWCRRHTLIKHHGIVRAVVEVGGTTVCRSQLLPRRHNKGRRD